MLLIIIIAPKNVERAKHKPKEDVMDKSEESEHYSLANLIGVVVRVTTVRLSR